MKKVFALLTVALLMFTVPLIAQATDPVDPPVIENYFVDLGALSGLVVIISLALFSVVKIPILWAKQLITWIISIALAFVGQVWNIGIFEGVNVVWTIILGIGGGLLANGIYDATFVQMILEFLKIKIPTKR
jgi:hypothetical protein